MKSLSSYKTEKQLNKKGESTFHFPLSTFHLPRQRRGGFTLLIAIVISSLLLSIGIAIFNITSKELRLSSLGRDSQFAFYAADSGVECALYWDRKGAAFATSSDSSSIPPGAVFCAGQDVTTSTSWSENKFPTSANTTFSLDFTPEEHCSIVVVFKNQKVGFPEIIVTTIESRGYNTCDVLDPRRVERAIRTIYENS